MAEHFIAYRTSHYTDILSQVPLADALDKHSESARDEQIIIQATTALKNKETIDTLVDEKPTVPRRRTKVLSGPVTFEDADKEFRREIADEAGEITTEPLKPLEDVGPVTPPVSHAEIGLRRRPRRVRTVSSPAVGGLDLWQVRTSLSRSTFATVFFLSNCYVPLLPPIKLRRPRKEDSRAQAAALAGAPSPPVQYDLQSGMRYGVARRQRMPSDLGVIAENAPSVSQSSILHH